MTQTFFGPPSLFFRNYKAVDHPLPGVVVRNPRCIGGSFATSVRELNANKCTLSMDKLDNTLERGDMFVRPKTIICNNLRFIDKNKESALPSGEMRPSGRIAVASTVIAPAPRVAKL
jgi:hypothetical protein